MADETPGSGSAFEILGRIGVDLSSLDESLKKSEIHAKDHAAKLNRIFAEVKGPDPTPPTGSAGAPYDPIARAAARVASGEQAKVAAAARAADEARAQDRAAKAAAKAASRAGQPPAGPPAGPPGGPPEEVGGGEGGAGAPGGRSATSNFAHLARVVSHTLIPALSQIQPELGKFVSIGATSARTAIFFGGALGGVAIAAALASEVIGRFVASAKEMSASTLDANKALALLDSARAEAGIAKITAKIAEYNQSVDIATGKAEGGFWQQLVAWADVAAEGVTGSMTQILAQLDKYEAASSKIIKKFDMPKLALEAAEKAAQLMVRQGEFEKRAAGSPGELAAAHDKVIAGTKDEAAQKIKSINLVRDKQIEADEEAASERLNLAKGKASAAREEIEGLTRLGVRDAADPKYATAFEQDFAKKKAQLIKLDAEVAEIEGRTNDRAVRTRQKAADDITDIEKNLTETVKQQSIERTQALAVEAAETEKFMQQAVKTRQKRIVGEASLAQAVAAAENEVAKIRRDHAGTAEGTAALEERLAAARKNAVGPLISAIKAENEVYASQRRELEGLIAAGVNVGRNQKELTKLEAEHLEDVGEMRRNLAKEEASQNAMAARERAARNQADIAAQDRKLAHAVATGRVSMRDQQVALEREQTDPMRSAAQQEQAEREVFALRREYAAAYFTYYRNLGEDMWEAQLQSARHLRDENVAGSSKWLEASQKVYDVYKAIYEQAKQIATQTVGIAAGEFEREQQEIAEKKNPRKGPKPAEMSLQDVDRLVQTARRRDEAIYAGGGGKPGDVSAAVGRKGLWQEMDRTGMSFADAFSKMQQTPEQRMMGEASMTFSTATDIFAAAVDRFAERAGEGEGGAGAQGGGGERESGMGGGRLGGPGGYVQTGYAPGSGVFGARGEDFGGAGARRARHEADIATMRAQVSDNMGNAFASVADGSRSLTPPGMFGSDTKEQQAWDASPAAQAERDAFPAAGNSYSIDYEGMGGAVTKTKGSFESASEAVRDFVGAVIEGAAAMRGSRASSDAPRGVLSTNSPKTWSSADSSAAGRNLFLESKRGPQTVESDV
jgi:hypothetical protein